MKTIPVRRVRQGGRGYCSCFGGLELELVSSRRGRTMADDSRDGVLSPSDCESDSELMAEAPNGSRSVCSKEPAWSSFGPRPLRKWVRKLRTKRAYSPQVDAADENADAGRSANGCDGSAASSLPPPRDRFNLVYFCMLLAGVGFLLPWSSYISAIDYFKDYLYGRDFPRVSEAIPLTYLFSTLFSAMFSVVVVNRFPRHGRIAFGYVTFSVSLLFVPLLDIGINNCTVSTRVSYYLTLLTVVLVGLGSGGMAATLYMYMYIIIIIIMTIVILGVNVYIYTMYMYMWTSTILAPQSGEKL